MATDSRVKMVAHWPAIRPLVVCSSAAIGLLLGAIYGWLQYTAESNNVRTLENTLKSYNEFIAFEIGKVDYSSVIEVSGFLVNNSPIFELTIIDSHDFNIFTFVHPERGVKSRRISHKLIDREGRNVGNSVIVYKAFDPAVLLLNILLVSGTLALLSAIFLSFAFSWYTCRYVERPASNLVAAIGQTITTNRPTMVEHAGEDILGRLALQFNRMQDHLRLLSDQQSELIQEKEKIAEDLRQSVDAIQYLRNQAEHFLVLQNRVLETTKQAVRFFGIDDKALGYSDTVEAELPPLLSLFNRYCGSKSMLQIVLDGTEFSILHSKTDLPEDPDSPIAYSVEVVDREKRIWSLTAFRFQIGNSAILCRDLTEERARESRIQHARRMDALGQLTGGVAHDFNNLLAIMAGQAELLSMQPGLTPVSKKYVHSIVSTAAKAGEVTSKLLRYSRFENLNEKLIRLDEHFDALLRLLREFVGANNKLSFSNTTDKYLFTNPGEFDSAIINIVKNARDALIQPGEINIKIEDANNLSASDPNFDPAKDYVRIEISDNGIGISEEQSELIFDPFFTTKSKGHGVGLGLSTVFSFVHRYKGWIDCKSTLNEGTVLSIIFPTVEPSKDMLNISDSLEKIKQTDVNVMIIEDELDLADVMKQIFDVYGASTEWHANIRSARSSLSSGNNKIDIFVVDNYLPDGSGFEFLADIRKYYPDALIVFMSGAPPAYFERSSDFDLFVRKPSEIMKLASQSFEAYSQKQQVAAQARLNHQ